MTENKKWTQRKKWRNHNAGNTKFDVDSFVRKWKKAVRTMMLRDIKEAKNN